MNDEQWMRRVEKHFDESGFDPPCVLEKCHTGAWMVILSRITRDQLGKVCEVMGITLPPDDIPIPPKDFFDGIEVVAAKVHVNVSFNAVKMTWDQGLFYVNFALSTPAKHVLSGAWSRGGGSLYDFVRKMVNKHDE